MTDAELDRETHESHVIDVGCHDDGAMTSYGRLNVVIDDVNDNKPTFSRQRYTGELYR